VAGTVSATLLTDVLHTSLMTHGADLLPVIAELVPASTPIARSEVHWGSPDVSNSPNQPVPATCTIDMGLYGRPMNPPRSEGSYAEHPPDGPLTPASAGEVITRPRDRRFGQWIRGPRAGARGDPEPSSSTADGRSQQPTASDGSRGW